MTNEQFDHLLGSALKRRAKKPVDEDAINRVLSRIAGPLPKQKQPLWRLPASPRMAALACCAALGFGIGLAGLDRPFDRLDASFTVGNRDIGSIVSEPDTLTGERP
jgi:hypothetical protein